MRRVTLTDTMTKEMVRLDFPDSFTMSRLIPAVRSALIEGFSPHSVALHDMIAEFGEAVLEQPIHEVAEGEDQSPYQKARNNRPQVSSVAITITGFKAVEKKQILENFPLYSDDDATIAKISANVAIATLGAQEAAVSKSNPAPTATKQEPVKPAPEPVKAAKQEPAKPAPEPVKAAKPEPVTTASEAAAAAAVEEIAPVDPVDAGEVAVTPQEDATASFVTETVDAGEVVTSAPAPAATVTTSDDDYDPAAQAALSAANRTRSRRFGG